MSGNAAVCSLFSSRRRGLAMIYTVLSMTVMLMFTSLAVDLGRVQVAKTELRRASDAIARYAVGGLATNTTAVQTRAIACYQDNQVDGRAVVGALTDLEYGTWNTSTRVFTVSGSGQNAIRVTLRCAASRGNAVPLTFAKIMGMNSIDISAQAVAMYLAPVNLDFTVAATSCPWLAGMPNGSVANPINPHSNPDYAPAAVPKLMSGVPLVPGQALNFDSIIGSANHLPSDINYGPDGNPGEIASNIAGAENGMSDLSCPYNAVVGVFLDASVPSSSMAPSNLDYSTAVARDFSSLSPSLKQPFFIGDGRRADGTTKQNFIVPAGATRLYIGIMDSYEWNNNQGSFSTTVIRPAQVLLVR